MRRSSRRVKDSRPKDVDNMASTANEDLFWDLGMLVSKLLLCAENVLPKTNALNRYLEA